MRASPGKYDGIAPRSFLENLRYRRALLRWVTAEGEDDEVHIARRDHVWQMCLEDPFFYFDSFVFTYNPRDLVNPSLPFILYDFQREALAGMIDALGAEDFLIEKSRDMGASWLCSGAFEWAWHFLPQKTSFLLVSRKEELVDKRGDMKSLMARLDFTLDHQPRWLRPRIVRTALNLVNVDNGSAINGESTTGDVGRGDRRTAVLLDEFAAVDDAHKVLRSTRDVTNCRIFNSTPNGAHGAFYDLRCKEDIRKFRFHWSLHPEKNRGLYTDETGRLRSPWYDRECSRCVHPMEIAQELDIDYNASEEQFFDDVLLNRVIKHTRDPIYSYQPVFEEITATLQALDPVQSGEFKVWEPWSIESPPPKGRYCVACDISQGTGATPSVASVGDLLTGERIAELVTTVRKPHVFAALAIALCRWFHNGLLIWETNGPGTVFTDTVLEIGYKNVYYRSGRVSVTSKTAQPIGWASNKQSKQSLLSNYRKMLSDGILVNYSKASLDECRSYTYGANGDVTHSRVRSKANTGSSSRENHGDRVIADALLAFVLEQHSVSSAKTFAAEELAPPPRSLASRRRFFAERERVLSTW